MGSDALFRCPQTPAPVVTPPQHFNLEKALIIVEFFCLSLKDVSEMCVEKVPIIYFFQGTSPFLTANVS